MPMQLKSIHKGRPAISLVGCWRQDWAGLLFAHAGFFSDRCIPQVRKSIQFSMINIEVLVLPMAAMVVEFLQDGGVQVQHTSRSLEKRCKLTCLKSHGQSVSFRPSVSSPE